MFQEGGSVSFHELEPALADAVSARAPKRGKSRAEFILNESTSSTIAITERGRKALEDSRGRVTIGRVTREILASGEWKRVHSEGIRWIFPRPVYTLEGCTPTVFSFPPSGTSYSQWDFGK